MEIWKDIYNFEGAYQISSFGNIRSLDRIITNSFGIDKKYKGMIRKCRVGNKGYLYCNIWNNQTYKTVKPHRLVAIHFIPNPDNKPQVNHKDGNKLNNNVENLEWSTSKENINHAWENGLAISKVGDNMNGAILKEIDIPIIRELSKSMTQQAIADIFKVNRATIQLVLYGKTWKHVK